MNYRHAFHAGNFADLVKHAVLLAAMERLRPLAPDLQVIDTHAGAGLYGLHDEAARRSGEAAAGIERLMAAADPPGVFAPLIAAVRACNAQGPLNRYPGSPWLAAQALAPQQSYLGCELRPDDCERLRHALSRVGAGRAQALQADGFVEAQARLAAGAPALLLVDPPYERADDYLRTAELIGARANPERQGALVWTPLKDLETFDAFIGRLEASGPRSLVVAETRIKPLNDPLRMNGCALVMIDLPDLGDAAQAAGAWVAANLGGEGAKARTYRLSPP